MKKILIALSVGSIAVSGATTTISLAYNNNFRKTDDKIVKTYAEITSYALRSAILYEQNGIDFDWMNTYNRNQRVVDVLPEVVGNNKINGINNDSKMDELYWNSFGDRWYNFVHDQTFDRVKVKSGSKLAEDYEAANEFAGKKPDESTSNTINLITVVLNLALGSKINSQSLKLILSFLDQSFVQDALKGQSVKDIIDTVNRFLNFEDPQFEAAVDSIVNALTEKDVKVDDQTFNEVLSQDTNNLFKALLIYVYKQKVKDDKDVDYAGIFFNKLNGQDDDRLVAKEEVDDVFAASYIIKFLNSFCRYVAQFNQYRSHFYTGPKNLFANNKNNKEVIEEVLSSKYKPTDGNSTWFKANENGETVYYSVINFQDFIANLQYYLVPDELNDPNGIYLRKLFLILFEGGTSTKNPLSNIILKNGLGTLISEFIFKLLKIDDNANINDSPILKAIRQLIKSDADHIKGLINDFLYWILNKVVNNESLESLFNVIKLVFSFFDEDTKKVIQPILDYFDSPTGKNYLNFPFDALYGGHLIPDLIEIIEPLLKKSNPSTDLTKFKKLTNLKTLLTANIGSIYKIFSDDPLPDVIYDLNKTSVVDIINQFSEFYNVKEENKAVDKLTMNPLQLDFYWNTQDIAGIVNNLTAKNSGITKDDKQIGILNPIYYAILGLNRSLDPQRDKEIIDNLTGVKVERGGETKTLIEPDPDDGTKFRLIDKAVEFILGLNNQTLEFIPNTVLYNLSRMYGTNYSKEEYELNQHLIPESQKTKPNITRHHFVSMEKASINLFTNIAQWVDKFADSSIKSVIQDKYSMYLTSKNFSLTNITSDGFDTKQNHQGQKLEFDLNYKNPDNDQYYTYHVVLTKGRYKDYPLVRNRGFILREFLLQN